MSLPGKRCWGARGASGAFALGVALALSGCGTPGPPLPPSLNLPNTVTNLSAVRAGEKVTLTWTMPRRNTDKMMLKGPFQVRVCRHEGSATCESAGELMLAPMASGTFSETLPATLASGEPRALSYFVEVRNRKGRSAGLSNAAIILAGQAPEQVADLTAEIRKAGVVLRWKPVDPKDQVRLVRTLENPPKAQAHSGPLAPPAELVHLALDVAADEGKALDKSIVFDRTYEYRAQRVARVEVDGKNVELAGELCAPVRIEARDVFPPAAPDGLTAVANPAVNGEPASIDLSWEPNTEPDLTGYFVYRREAETPWQRISGAQPVAAPAYHDATVLAGHTYIYGVSAADRKGYESGRSADAQETVPQQ